MKAMLLAAGLGTRMAPLAPSWSKPALPVLDQPLILGLARSLARQGIESIVVNTHRNTEALRRALRDAPLPVELSHEARLRGSGGGILHARPLLAGSGPFLVLNADMCIDLDVEALLEAHVRSGAPVTLALRDDPRIREFGSLGRTADGFVCRITDLAVRGPEGSCGLFTGVHVMENAIFDEMPDDRPCFDIVRDLYVPWVRSGRPLAAWMQPAGAFWQPVGSPQELLDANLMELERRAVASAGGTLIAHTAVVEGQVAGPAWIGAGARVPGGARVGPGAVIGARACLPGGIGVERSLVLPGSRPPEGGRLLRAIAFGGRIWEDA